MEKRLAIEKWQTLHKLTSKGESDSMELIVIQILIIVDPAEC